jgi:hypothetical protein
MTVLCPHCRIAPVGLTWISRTDCEERHVEAFKMKQGKAADERAGKTSMQKPEQSADLLVKGVKDAALRRAISRTK